MKQYACFALLIILIAPMISSSLILAKSEIALPQEPLADQYERGYRFNHQGWIYVHIEGIPYKRGFQHGYLLSAEIQDAVTRWSHTIHNYPKLKFISQHLSKEKYEQVAELWWNFCTSRCRDMYWDKFPQEYKLEIMGIDIDLLKNNKRKIINVCFESNYGIFHEHVGGHLGFLINELMFKKNWLEKKNHKKLKLTELGISALDSLSVDIRKII